MLTVFMKTKYHFFKFKNEEDKLEKRQSRTRKSTKTKVENLLIVHPERSVRKARKMLN